MNDFEFDADCGIEDAESTTNRILDGLEFLDEVQGWIILDSDGFWVESN